MKHRANGGIALMKHRANGGIALVNHRANSRSRVNEP
jgi:hypothetical protein